MLSLDFSPTTATAPLHQMARVLVVEDEDLIRDLVVIALEEEGYEVSTAVDGSTALNIFKNQASEPAEANIDLITVRGFGYCFG